MAWAVSVQVCFYYYLSGLFFAPLWFSFFCLIIMACLRKGFVYLFEILKPKAWVGICIINGLILCSFLWLKSEWDDCFHLVGVVG